MVKLLNDDNRAFVRTMDKLGYKHLGFPVGYDSMEPNPLAVSVRFKR